MTPRVKSGDVLLTTLVSAVTFGLGAGRVEAQWGMGGFGFGLYGGGFVPNIQQPGNFLNQVALSQMGNVRGPIQNNPYAGNPNAYFNHVRDNGFVDRYDISAREPYSSRYMASGAPRRATPTSMTLARPRPVVPLTGFFNAQGQLTWPGDAPTAGDLKEKREAVDRAIRAVLDETKKNGVASIASVTEARQKLLEYGRPALQYVRTHETPAVADAFHAFLLSLYDSLAAAANPPTETAGTPNPSPAS